jgi:hypothetical protein
VEPIAVFLYFDWQQLLQFCRKQLQQGLVALRCMDCFYGDGHRSLLSSEAFGSYAFVLGKIISLHRGGGAGDGFAELIMQHLRGHEYPK